MTDEADEAGLTGERIPPPPPPLAVGYADQVIAARLSRLVARCRVDPVLRSEVAGFLAGQFTMEGGEVVAWSDGRSCILHEDAVQIRNPTWGGQGKRVPL